VLRGNAFAAVAATAVAALTITVAGCANAGAGRSIGDGVVSRAAAGEPPEAAAHVTTATPDAGGRMDWVEDYGAVCVSMVRGVAPAKAVEELTAGRAKAFANREDAEDWVAGSADDGSYWIGAGQVGQWTFVWEDNGFQGSLDRTAARLSAGSVFVSAYWNVNAVEAFTYARDGQVVRQFDPVLDPPGGGSGDALPAETRLDWEDAEASMLRLQSTVTGEQAADPAWLDAPGVSFWGFTQ
jgi:uncharacterized protein DUF6461